MLTSLFIFSVIALNFGFWGDSFQNTLCNVHVFGISDFIKCDKMKSDLTFKAGSNMQLSLDNTTSTITITAQTQKDGNTAQIFDAGSGYGLFSSKYNATANYLKSLKCSGAITCSSNSTSIELSAVAVGTSLKLDDLTDVVILSPTTYQFLRYDGANWVNQAVTFTDTDTNTAQIVSAGGTSLFKARNNATENSIKGLTTTKGITLTSNTNDIQIDTSFLSVSKTCSVGQFVNAYDSSTGLYTCATPSDTNTAQIVSAGGTSLFAGRNNATENSIKGLTTTQGITLTSNANDVRINTSFFSISKTCSVGQFVNAYDSSTGLYTCATPTFSDTNTAQIVSAGGTSLFKARNNATENSIKGLTTTKGITLTSNTNDIQIDTNFKVNTKTCAAGQFVSAYTNATNLDSFTCATPTSSTKRGGDLLASWDSSSTKTNIGTTFVDIFTGTSSNGKGILIDTDTYTQVRLHIQWNKIGSGTQTVQVVDIANAANVLITLNVVSGSNDSGWVSIPAGLLNAEKDYKLQAKSTVNTDDPVFENGVVWLK